MPPDDSADIQGLSICRGGHANIKLGAMFTGIVTALGEIDQIADLGADASHGKRLRVRTPAGYLDDVTIGDSIAINGACMTAIAFDAADGWFAFDVSAESLARTAGLDRRGPVNLEKALRATDRLGGHLVSGHVDGIGRVMEFAPLGESWHLVVQAPRDLAPYLAYKGSITINGVSLTVNRVVDVADGCQLHVNLIPHTVQSTTLQHLSRDAVVNLEVDLIARYVQRMLSTGPAPGASGAVD